MLRQINYQEEFESRHLSPYAVRSSDSKGRRFPEAGHPFRTDFQRDRDRILHCRAFRRMEYKTQVFVNERGDHFRTRLTHSIEVAAVTRTIARALGLNEDLAETIALAHDLGHTPFGHAGERRMHHLMRLDGGFDHNLQALRVVDELEIKYPGYNGLNLSWEVRAGLLKHREHGEVRLDNITLPRLPTLEAQVADLADDLTYYGHDVDDGVVSGLLNNEMLSTLEIWQQATAISESAGLTPGSDRHMSFSVRNLIDMMVGDAIRSSAEAIASAKINSPAGAQAQEGKLIVQSPPFHKMTGELRAFLFDNMYFHPEVKQENDAVAAMMEFIFHTYVDNPAEMGNTARRRIANDGLKRAVADYIAGMTDRFAQQEFRRLTEITN